jgi:hypothetical protein
MRMNEDISYSHPLDVLKRFMPAPISMEFFQQGKVFRVETNDLKLVEPFVVMEAVESTHETATWRWKLLRDVDVDDALGELTFFLSERLVVVSLGPACLIGADHERKELLGFIGSAVGKEAYESEVVPILMQLPQLTRAFGIEEGSGELRQVISESVPCGG